MNDSIAPLGPQWNLMNDKRVRHEDIGYLRVRDRRSKMLWERVSCDSLNVPLMDYKNEGLRAKWFELTQVFLKGVFFPPP